MDTSIKVLFRVVLNVCLHSFCSECFLRYCAHKFRSSFGKSRLIRDQENVMLAFSGGQASSAMVHLVREVSLHRSAQFNKAVFVI